ncbi:MAG: hypothetical protein LBI84_08465 [Propionibacteriaceae bacterium]|nr:hypothetical protein [Propionibacteriaceae bacterium]
MTNPYDGPRPDGEPLSSPDDPPQPRYSTYPVDGSGLRPGYADPDPAWAGDSNAAGYAPPTPGYYAPDPAAALAVPPRQKPTHTSGQPFGWSPDAPYGRDHATGEPLSNKRKIIAALGELFLGCFGAGRLYIGDLRTGLAMAGLTVAAIFASVVFAYGWMLWVALGFWWVVDFILIASGHVRDGDGRKLK